MYKVEFHLPAELKSQLAATAQREGRSEAELIRESIQLNLWRRNAPEPTLPLFSIGPADLAENSESKLDGFGYE